MGTALLDTPLTQTLPLGQSAGGGEPVDGERLSDGALIAERFRIDRLAAVGGMAAVYRAIDTRTGDAVALKVLERPSHDEAQRFAQEAEVLSALAHPAIVRYVAHGPSTDGGIYIAMQWVEGEDLAARLKRGVLAPDDALALVQRVAETLAVAHAAGVVHRDVKPGNILLAGGSLERPMLCDFGVARVGASRSTLRRASRVVDRDEPSSPHVRASELTQHDALFGTLGYMAPEQARCEREIDARADVYALGCVLHTCLTGAPPFVGEDLVALVGRIALDRAPALRERWPEAPEALDALLRELLATHAHARPRDAAAVATRIRLYRTLSQRRDRPRAASVWSEDERMLVAVVLLRARMDSEIERIAAEHGARAVALADGSSALVCTSHGEASDLAVRAGRCALAITRARPALKVALALGQTSVDRSPIGPVIERAAALLHDVSPGRPRADHVGARLLRQRFRLTDLGPCAELIDEIDGAQRDEPRGLWVGRDDALVTLSSWYDERVEREAAGLAVVIAPSGAGKTRLCEEWLRRQAPRGLVLRCAGDPLRGGAPYAMITDTLARWAGLRAASDGPSRAAHLRERLATVLHGQALAQASLFLGQLLDAHIERADKAIDRIALQTAQSDAKVMNDQRQRALESWLLALAEQHESLLWVWEDLHWGDAASVRLLRHALALLQGRPLAVLAFARPEVRMTYGALLDEHHARLIELSPLDRAACEAIARHALPEIDETALDAIVSRSGGNPFFVEELTRALRETRASPLSPSAPQSVPESVLASVQARIELLSTDERAVLRAMSVFGRTVERDAVRALLQGPSLDRWFEQLALGQWIIESSPTTVSFAHDLLREATYAMFTDEARAAAHRSAGAWLEAQPDAIASTLAEHFELGLDAERAARWRYESARAALAAVEHAQVIEHAERGLQLTSQRSLRGSLWLVIARARWERAETHAAIDDARRARASLEPASDLWCEALAVMAVALGRQGRSEELRAVGEALAAVSDDRARSAWWVEAAARCAVALLQCGLRSLAEALLARAELDLDLREKSHPLVAAVVWRARYSNARRERRPWDAIEAGRRAVALMDRAGARREALSNRINVAFALIEIGDFDIAAVELRACVEQAELLGSDDLLTHAMHNLGWALARGSHDREGIALLDVCITICEQLELGRIVAACNVYASVSHALHARWDEAERYAVKALERSAPYAPLHAYALACRARAHLARGQREAALACAERAESLRESLGPIEGEAWISLALVLALDGNGLGVEARETQRAAVERVHERALALEAGPMRERFYRVAEHVELFAIAAP